MQDIVVGEGGIVALVLHDGVVDLLSWDVVLVGLRLDSLGHSADFHLLVADFGVQLFLLDGQFDLFAFVLFCLHLHFKPFDFGLDGFDFPLDLADFGLLGGVVNDLVDGQ